MSTSCRAILRTGASGCWSRISESTIIEQECLDELADYIGLRDRIAGITQRAMRGELDFAAALKERVGLLAGLDAKVLDELYDRVTLMPGAETLIRTMKAHGATCVLVSGRFTYFTERLPLGSASMRSRPTRWRWTAASSPARSALPILGREAKLSALQRLTADLGLRPAQTMAVGDGANDLAMIKAAGLGVAFRAKPIVAAEAAACIAHGDLTALLYLQGYERSEFAIGLRRSFAATSTYASSRHRSPECERLSTWQCTCCSNRPWTSSERRRSGATSLRLRHSPWKYRWRRARRQA